MRAKDLIPPVNSRSKSGRLWSLILHPQERGQASKIQEFDENILFDLEYTHCIAKSVFQWQGLGNAQGNTMIFSKGVAELRAAMTTAATRCNLATLGDVHPYRLRHGGASKDFATQERDLVQIQRRGRWKTTASVRRDEKGWSVEPTASQPFLRPSFKRHSTQAGRSKESSNSGVEPFKKSHSAGLSGNLLWLCAIISCSCKNYRVAGVLMWDITLGSEYDLRMSSNRRLILEWVRCNWVVGFHLGTPCESFS